MKFDRFDYLVWSVMGVLALAIAGVVLAGDHVGARVARTFPEDGGEIGALGPVGLEFGQPMQAASVEARFAVEPAAAGRLEWEAGTLWFRPARALQLGVTYTARLEAGALSREGRATQQALTWRFTVRAPWIVYMASVSGPREVWRVPAAGGAPEQLTHTDGRVYDFAAAPDGERLAYSVVNDQNGADLWLVNRDGGEPRRLVLCEADLCTVPAWSPWGDRLAYSREPAGIAPGAPNGPPRVWTVDPASGQTAPLYQNSQVLGYGPVWSPDGRRLAFFDGGEGSIRLVDLETSQEMLIKTLMGTVGAWAPDGRQMLYNDMNLETGQPYVTLALADFDTQTITPLLGQEPNWADYSVPAWSPDGQWLALALRAADSGPTKQIWLMRPDASEARAVTRDPAYTFGGYRWDPWGTGLVFQRFELNTPYATPEVGVWSAVTGAVTILVADGATPEWLP
jgi:Tol biopolymer transport system component